MSPVSMVGLSISPPSGFTAMRSAPMAPPFTVLAASSRPMRATTGPMAAGGRTMSIQSVPNFHTTRASRQPSSPVTTKPPWAYSKPSYAMTMPAGAKKAKLEPR